MEKGEGRKNKAGISEPGWGWGGRVCQEHVRPPENPQEQPGRPPVESCCGILRLSLLSPMAALYLDPLHSVWNHVPPHLAACQFTALSLSTKLSLMDPLGSDPPLS